MANDDIPRPATQFPARRNNFAAYVNGHLADLGLAAGVMEAEIRGRVAWASRPRSCDPPPPGNRSVTAATADFFNSPAVPIHSSCGAAVRTFSSRDSSKATVAAHAG